MNSGTWLLIAFYAFCAVSIAWLLRRRRRRQQAAGSPRSRVSRKNELQDGRVPSPKGGEANAPSETEAGAFRQPPELQADQETTDRPSGSTPSDRPAALSEPAPSGSSDSAAASQKEAAAAAGRQQPAQRAAERRPAQRVGGATAARTRVDGPEAPSAGPAALSDAHPLVDESSYVFGSLTPVLAALLPETKAREQQIRRELLQAGYLSPVAYQNLAAIRYVAVVGTLLLFGVLLILVPRQMEMPVLVALVAGPLAAWALPRFYVSSRAKRRVQEIDRALPDLLDMLNMCVSQGLGVLPAMRRIARELRSVYPDLSDELLLVCHQAELGSLEQALNNLRHRLDSPDVHSFANLLIQTERMGTSISDALTDYSDTMRGTIRQRADQKANQASFKLMFPTVLCLMPAVFLFLLGPAVVELNKFVEQGGTELFQQSPVETIDQIQSQTPRQVEPQ